MNYANDTKIAQDGSLIGDPTETALVQFGLDHQLDLTACLQQEPRVAELPIDSERKLMSTIHQLSNGKYLVAVKGAPDVLIERTSRVLSQNQELVLTEQQREEILFNNTDMAKQALRVLAMGYKIIDELPAELTSAELENDLVFAGLVGMIDPERKEAAEAVRLAKSAGIRPIMITGDHKDTAEAIAARLGIIRAGNNQAVLTGAELNEMSDEEFAKRVYDYSVLCSCFART